MVRPLSSRTGAPTPWHFDRCQVGVLALQASPERRGETQISYVGYKTQDVDIAPDIRVKLEPDAQAVEAVVVTG